MKNSFLLFLLILLNLNYAKSQNNENFDSKTYILFSARNPSLIPFSLGGHGFVSWVKQTQKDTINLNYTLGFYPNLETSIIEKIFEFHEGRIEKDYSYNKNGKKIEQIIFEVDTLTWCNSQDISFLKEKKNWNLMQYNCVYLMDEVAEILKLKRPKTKIMGILPLRPVRYIKKLRKLNKDRVSYIGYVCLKDKSKCL